MGSFGHIWLKYFSSPWPCTIIPVKVIGNCPRLDIILLHACNLESAIFAWSSLSWIMHKNSSFNHIDSVLQVWYKFLYASWSKICFFSFASYSKASLLLLFPNLDIKFFKDSQTMHFANIDPCFCTLTFKWSLFLNLLIPNWKIPLMFNSLLIYHPTNTKKQKNSRLSTMLHILSTIFNPFHLMRHHICRQTNQWLNIRFCLLGWHM